MRYWLISLLLLFSSQLLFAQTQSSPINTGEDQYSVNLINADIASAVKAIGLITKRSLIVDPRVKGTITLQLDKKISSDAVWEIFLSQLRLQGIAVVNSDGFYKVVPEPEGKLQGGARSVQSQERNDQIVTRVFRLINENANAVLNVVRPLIPPNNVATVAPNMNALVITDYASNLERIANVIETIDKRSHTNIKIITLKYVTASDAVAMIERLVMNVAASKNATGESDSVVADNKSNAILVRTQNPTRLEEIEALVTQLEEQSINNKVLRVVYLQNARADELAQTLRLVLLDYGSGATVSSTKPLAQSTTATKSTTSTSTNTTSSASLSFEVPGGGSIQADIGLNALVIRAPEPLYRSLLEAIKLLDVRRPQVYIESLIVEVNADSSNDIGFQWQALLGAQSRPTALIGTNFGSGADNLLQAGIAISQGQSPGILGNGLQLALANKFGANYTLGALARFFEQSGGANILSTPSLLTLDNQEAKIVIGQNLPFKTGQYTQSGSAAINPFQTIERRDVGLTLKVKPQVSQGGVIKLEISQEVSSLASTSTADGPITAKRSIESVVLVNDGQTVALGGLIEDSSTNTTSKVPGVGDIPVLGGLFRSQSAGRRKTNLMIFLRPTVLRDSQSATNIANTRYESLSHIAEKNQQIQEWKKTPLPVIPRVIPSPQAPLTVPSVLQP